MDDSLIEQAAAPGVSPLVIAAPASRSTLDLSGARSRKTSERVIGWVLFLCAAVSVMTSIGIVFVLFEQAIEFFTRISIVDFLTGTKWTPLFKSGQYGVLPLVSATLMVSGIAMLLALPLGLMSAIYLSEYAPARARAWLKPVLELLAGVPTIVYGYFALTFISPQILKPIVPGLNPFNALAAGIAVGIMILPMVASLSEDAMRVVPGALREAAYSLGATKLEVSTKVVFPAALSGIFASAMLAISRAVGETMIVAVAAGLRPQLTGDPREGMETMTAWIVQLVSGEAVVGSTPYLSLFAVGALLFLITLALNIISQRVVARYRQAYQ